MADNRRLETIDLKGNAYAKVAERMRQFRSDWPRGKTETNHYEVDGGQTEFRCWIWKNKDDYVDVLKATGDLDIARGSADADGFARKKLSGDKDFEKLQTIATGRALAMLGYLSSGEIASFEEMEDFWQQKKAAEAEKNEQAIKAALEAINDAKTDEDLNKAFMEHKAVFKIQEVVDAGKAKRAELSGEKPVEKKPAAKQFPELEVEHAKSKSTEKEPEPENPDDDSMKGTDDEEIPGADN